LQICESTAAGRTGWKTLLLGRSGLKSLRFRTGSHADSLARGFFEAGAKALDPLRTLSRNAEALLPSAKAEGSHQADGTGARWEPPHLCGGWSASALQKQGSTSNLRFSAGQFRGGVFPQPVKPGP
jgi:hypothetical protein